MGYTEDMTIDEDGYKEWEDHLIGMCPDPCPYCQEEEVWR